MIRTRDLLVFLGVLFFVLLGIAFTLLSETEQKQALSFFTLQDEGQVEYTAEGDTRALDRESIIERLRNALAQNESTVEPAPSVEESEESKSEEDVRTPHAGVTYCATYDDSTDAVRAWPLSAEVRVEGASRMVLEMTPKSAALEAASTTPASSSSSATVQTQTRTLLSLPLYPVETGESCVSGEAIGVTPAGSLIFNSQVALYRGYGPQYLIGYARDGFPIYGYYEGEVDACGGYMHATGYRYSITPDRDHVLSCYKGTPASFTGS